VVKLLPGGGPARDGSRVERGSGGTDRGAPGGARAGRRAAPVLDPRQNSAPESFRGGPVVALAASGPAGKRPRRAQAVLHRAAVTGSIHPASGSNVIFEPRSPRPTGLNTNTGPRWRRMPAVTSERSVRVEVASTAPGASKIPPANHPVLPRRGPPNTNTTSSIEDHTVYAPTRHNNTPTSLVDIPAAPPGPCQPGTGAPSRPWRALPARSRTGRYLTSTRHPKSLGCA
jgi:hypothetical protein